MSKLLARKTRDSGAALVVTMIVCVVLSMVAVALMQNTSLDRASSRGVMNHYHAQLAAQAGLAAAEAMLAAQTGNDHFIVVAKAPPMSTPSPTPGGTPEPTPAPELFVGVGSNQPAGTFAYRPLLSFTENLADLVTTNTNEANTVFTAVSPEIPSTMAVNRTNTFRFTMPGTTNGEADLVSPELSWVYLTNSQGQTNARFAFWVEDLGGRLDLSVVGTTNSDVARRPTGTNPAEIPLWSLFDPTSPNDPGNVTASKLVSSRANILTTATARLVDTNKVSAGVMADLAVGLIHDTGEPEVIPFGFGYADQGKAKVDLNTAAFAKIRDTINNNLTNFGTRGGGLSASDYVDNVAASITDFVDLDASPTAGANYRGVEPIPFLNERMTRFVLQGPPVQAGRRGWVIRIETTEYFEFWNLHSRTSPATTVNFVFNNNQPLQYSGRTNFNISTNYPLTIPAMPPGSYFVTNSPTITNEFSVNSFESPSTNPICELVGNSRTVQYALQAGGVAYDRGSGSHYSDKKMLPGDLVYFSPSYPGLGSKQSIAGIGDGDFLNAVGDPRSTFHLVDGGQPRPQIQPSWLNGNTSFGGRTLQGGMSTARLSKEVRMANWGDGGHSGTPGSSGAGTTPPTSGLFVTNEVDFAPAFANPNTSGRLDRITDLGGGIFDPLQWGEPNQSTNWPKEAGAWTNVTASATPNTAYAGGHTLRFGRPEFTRFTNNGTRAAQLLDIFAVSDAANVNSGVLLKTVPGRININTAGTNVLRALAAGVFHSNDRKVASGSGAGTNFVVPKAAVDGFVAGVENFRDSRPFYSPSQLPLISTNSGGTDWPAGSVFGNRSLMGITAGNAAVAEEWFSRIYPLTTVRSRNFLVHVVGQALQTNGLAVLSEDRAVFQIYLQPVRDDTGDDAGLTTNSIPRVIRSWSL